ncbi:hypothetical protein DMH25_08290 [Streptomyces sp. WAC 01325]|nr:hypothetical protein DMH25_08290 [Streptomyces sp. WAC 01325]
MCPAAHAVGQLEAVDVDRGEAVRPLLGARLTTRTIPTCINHVFGYGSGRVGDARAWGSVSGDVS